MSKTTQTIGAVILIAGVVLIAYAFGFLVPLGLAITGLPEIERKCANYGECYNLKDNVFIEGEPIAATAYSLDWEYARGEAFIIDGKNVDADGRRLFGNCSEPPGAIRGCDIEFSTLLSSGWHKFWRTPREDAYLEFYVDSKLCQIPNGYMLATQDFAARQTITMDSFRYKVEAFCYRAPVLRLALDTEIRLGQTIEPYKFIQTGGYVTIPENEVWRFNYVMKLTPEIDVVCGEGIYNTETKVCEVKPGFIYICSQGIYDPNAGECVIQPQFRRVCEEGVYNTETDMCEKYIPAGEVIVCPERAIYDDATQKCIFSPQEEIVCVRGTYNPATNTCLVTPEVELEPSPISPQSNKFVFLISGIMGIAVGAFVLAGGLGRWLK